MQNGKQNEVKREHRTSTRRKPRASDKFGIFSTHELKQLAALYRKQKPTLAAAT